MCLLTETVLTRWLKESNFAEKENVYKNTDNFTYQIFDTHPHGKKISCIHKKLQNTTCIQSYLQLFGIIKKEQQRAMCFMPHWALHASFLSFQMHKQSCFPFIEWLCCACPGVFSSNGGKRVCKSGSTVTLRHHEGRFSGLTNKNLTRMSHISKI